MSFDQLVAVSGISGIQKIVTQRSNGLIVEDLDSGKRRFAPSRKHQFSPLISIGIFTDDGDAKELKAVFQEMKSRLADLPVPDHNGKKEDILAYMDAILPNYDRDRVYFSDMKRMIKWFKFLNERDLLPSSDEEE